METIKLKTYIGNDGVLKLEMPTHLKDVDAEVVIVLHPATTRTPIDNGFPRNYFDAIDAIEADDLIERPAQGILNEKVDLL